MTVSVSVDMGMVSRGASLWSRVEATRKQQSVAGLGNGAGME